MKARVRIGVVAAAALSLAIAGCATPGGGSQATGDGDPCNPFLGAAVGAAIGALVDKDKRGRGALIGGGVGALACVVVNAASRQTQTAVEVEDAYRKTHQGRLPPNEPVVQAYKVSLNPESDIRPGEKAQVVSTATVVRGANQPVNEVKEKLTLSGPQGERSAEKVASERPGSGTYENTFNVTFPKGLAPGDYPLKTQLYVNGKQVEERQQDLRIVAEGEKLKIVLLPAQVGSR